MATTSQQHGQEETPWCQPGARRWLSLLVQLSKMSGTRTWRSSAFLLLLRPGVLPVVAWSCCPRFRLYGLRFEDIKTLVHHQRSNLGAYGGHAIAHLLV